MTEGTSQPASAAATPALATTIKPTDLRGILKYVPRFQGQIFVIALDGSIVADDNFSNLLVDIAVLRSLHIKVVLVHGIGLQIKELSDLRGVPISDVDGTGVTDAATLDLAIRASSRVSHLVLEGLAQNNLKGVITNSVRALPTGILKGVDQQLTGRVDRIDKDFLSSLINEQVIPVVSPLAFGADGKSLRVNSDLLAAELAEALSATKIIYLTPQLGLEINGEVRPQIAVEVLRKQLAEAPDQIAALGHSKAVNAVRAIDSGTPRVHLVDGRILDGLLNEIFSNEGVGTLIYGNDYQQIRKATRRDVRMIHSLTRAAVKREELLHRTLQFYTEIYLQDGILAKVDRASMMHGLEARSPFLDIEVADFARRLPGHYKLRQGTTKFLLKKALEPVLPADILHRRKKGFGTPVGAWFRSGRIAPSSTTPIVQKRLASHRAGRSDERLFLWCQLTLDEWLKRRSF